MNRTDERMQMKGGKVSREADDPEGREGEGASMARSPAAAKRGEAADPHEPSRGSESKTSAQKTRHIDADHVIGDGGGKGSPDADTFSDMASSGANRKEAGEPEREVAEQAAMGRDRATPHKNVMGHGERETVAKHTI